MCGSTPAQRLKQAVFNLQSAALRLEDAERTFRAERSNLSSGWSFCTASAYLKARGAFSEVVDEVLAAERALD